MKGSLLSPYNSYIASYGGHIRLVLQKGSGIIKLLVKIAM